MVPTGRIEGLHRGGRGVGNVDGGNGEHASCCHTVPNGEPGHAPVA
jgi:hypothetical protein